MFDNFTALRHAPCECKDKSTKRIGVIFFVDCGEVAPDFSFAIINGCAGIGLPKNKAVFTNNLFKVLGQTGLHPSRLELELTETTLMNDKDRVNAQLKTLSDAGVTIALDDFGTGFSSLSYLQQLHIHRLKIDRSFVLGLTESSQFDNAQSIVKIIFQLADSLELDITVEGVETEGQLEILQTMGNFTTQGFFYCQPLQKADIQDYLKNTNQPRQ